MKAALIQLATERGWKETKPGLWLKCIEFPSTITGLWLDVRGEKPSVYSYKDGKQSDEHRRHPDTIVMLNLISAKGSRSLLEF